MSGDKEGCGGMLEYFQDAVMFELSAVWVDKAKATALETRREGGLGEGGGFLCNNRAALNAQRTFVLVM